MTEAWRTLKEISTDLENHNLKLVGERDYCVTAIKEFESTSRFLESKLKEITYEKQECTIKLSQMQDQMLSLQNNLQTKGEEVDKLKVVKFFAEMT